MGTALCSLHSPRQPLSTLAPTPCALAAVGTLPQSPPRGFLPIHGCKKRSPKAGAGLTACLRLISPCASLQSLLMSCPGGPPALQTKPG